MRNRIVNAVASASLVFLAACSGDNDNNAAAENTAATATTSATASAQAYALGNQLRSEAAEAIASSQGLVLNDDVYTGSPKGEKYTHTPSTVVTSTPSTFTPELAIGPQDLQCPRYSQPTEFHQYNVSMQNSNVSGAITFTQTGGTGTNYLNAYDYDMLGITGNESPYVNGSEAATFTLSQGYGKSRTQGANFSFQLQGTILPGDFIATSAGIYQLDANNEFHGHTRDASVTVQGLDGEHFGFSKIEITDCGKTIKDKPVAVVVEEEPEIPATPVEEQPETPVVPDPNPVVKDPDPETPVVPDTPPEEEPPVILTPPPAPDHCATSCEVIFEEGTSVGSLSAIVNLVSSGDARLTGIQKQGGEIVSVKVRHVDGEPTESQNETTGRLLGKLADQFGNDFSSLTEAEKAEALQVSVTVLASEAQVYEID